MDKNLEPIAKELFGKIRTQFPKIKLGDANSNVTDRPKDARFFEFDFIKNRKNLGSISISIADAESEANEDDLADNDGMVVMYSNDITDDQPDSVKRQWFNFLRELREFAKQNMMNFSIRDITKKNLDKRDYQHLAKKNGEGSMTESKLWGTSKTSYQQMGEAKLIVKHSQPVNYAHAAGRTLHIESIYVENSVGERFKYPVKHLNGARALATHVAHGGTPYDGIGEHITGLSEELNKLRMFKGYVDRNSMVSEAMGTIQAKVYERIDQVKKEIRSLQNQSYYESFAESFTVNEAQEIPEDLVNDWVDRLTIRTFNEELKNVFPYIYKLVGEEVDIVKELSADDLLSERVTSEWIELKQKAMELLAKGMTVEQVAKQLGVQGPNNGLAGGLGGQWGAINAAQRELEKTKPALNDSYTDNQELAEFNDFESFLNTLVSEESDLFNTDEESQSASIQKLNQLISQEFPAGVDGTNAVQSLQGIIDDQEFTDAVKQLGKVNPEMDIREFLKGYLEKYDEENGTDIASKINFDSTTPAPTEPAPAPAEPAAAAAPAPAAPPVDPAAAAPAPAPVAEEKEEDPPFDGPYKKPSDNKDQFGNTIKNKARHLAKKGMAAAIAKAKKAGATAETMVNFGSGEMSLGEAITKAGMDVEEFFEGTGKQHEVVEFVKSMYDETTGNFPKGETGVLLAVEKQFGEDAAEMAHSVISELSQVYESKRLRQLAGITEAGLGGMNMDVDQMFKNISNQPGATKTSNFKSTINGKQDDSEAGYNAAMGKFRDMSKGMGFDADGEDPVGGMMKGIQDKFGNMTKSMNMPTIPGASGQPTSQAPAKQDPKTMLKALPDAKLSTMSGDEAKKMLADLKKMAGL
jgi:transcriptional regulator with XRE-family HTH domain